jgi:hypothetical protein
MRIPVLLGAFALLACTESTAPHTDLLRATAHNAHVRLASLSGESVYFMVVEREFAALAQFVICSDPVSCPSVSPRETLHVRYSDIAGYQPGAREAIVLHWRLVPAASGGFDPDSVRALVTRLR